MAGTPGGGSKTTGTGGEQSEKHHHYFTIINGSSSGRVKVVIDKSCLPLSGITLFSQNAGYELAQRSVPDILQCGESPVPGLMLPSDLEHP